MIGVRVRLTATVAVLASLTLAASGCASKKYVSQQIAPVNQRLDQFEKQTDNRLTWLNNKQQIDVSQLNERIATTDQNVHQLSVAVRSAQGSAARAMEEAGAAKTAVEKLETGIDGALNYKLLDRTDVLFGFGKSDLTPQAKATLDDIATRYRSANRGVIELAGFTDPRGSAKYNLELSRRRAWAVQRYLVNQNVPTRAIHMVGLGKENAPAGLGLEGASTDGISRRDRYQEDRRVNIRLFTAGEIASSDGTR